MTNLHQLEEFKKYVKGDGSDLSDDELQDKLDKFILKIRTEAYDKGYQAGANQMGNDPCVCGFWGNKK